MTPLETHKQMWTWLCVCPCPPNKDTSKWNKVVYMIFTSVIIASEFTAIFASLAFVVKFMRTDFESCLYAFLIWTAYMGITAIMVYALISRRKISWIFEELTKIHQKCEFLIRSVSSSRSTLNECCNT